MKSEEAEKPAEIKSEANIKKESEPSSKPLETKKSEQPAGEGQ
jgi:hypothetical protein